MNVYTRRAYKMEDNTILAMINETRINQYHNPGSQLHSETGMQTAENNANKELTKHILRYKLHIGDRIKCAGTDADRERWVRLNIGAGVIRAEHGYCDVVVTRFRRRDEGHAQCSNDSCPRPKDHHYQHSQYRRQISNYHSDQHVIHYGIRREHHYQINTKDCVCATWWHRDKTVKDDELQARSCVHSILNNSSSAVHRTSGHDKGRLFTRHHGKEKGNHWWSADEG